MTKLSSVQQYNYRKLQEKMNTYADACKSLNDKAVALRVLRSDLEVAAPRLPDNVLKALDAGFRVTLPT